MERVRLNKIRDLDRMINNFDAFRTRLLREHYDLTFMAELFGVTVGGLRGKEQTRKLADLRLILSYHLRRKYKFKYVEIATILGKHHSTIVKNVQRYDELLKHDVVFQSQVKQFNDAIQNL